MELSNLKIEMLNENNNKMMEYREKLENAHQKKLNNLKKRESDVLDRIKDKERIIEQNAYEHRQKLLKDIETMRLRDEDFNSRNDLFKKEIKLEKDKIKELNKSITIKEKELSNDKNNYEKKYKNDIES